jgi:hypothetical protein
MDLSTAKEVLDELIPSLGPSKLRTALSCPAMKGCNSRLGEGLFSVLGHRIGKSPLEPH